MDQQERATLGEAVRDRDAENALLGSFDVQVGAPVRATRVRQRSFEAEPLELAERRISGLGDLLHIVRGAIAVDVTGRWGVLAFGDVVNNNTGRRCRPRPGRCRPTPHPPSAARARPTPAPAEAVQEEAVQEGARCRCRPGSSTYRHRERDPCCRPTKNPPRDRS